MASTSMRDDDGRNDHIRILLHRAKKLKRNIQTNEKKIHHLRNRHDGSDQNEIKESVGTGIEDLYKDQELLKGSFCELDKYFVGSVEHGNFALSVEGNKGMELILALKCRVENLKKEQEVLNQKLEEILSNLEVSDDETGSTNTSNLPPNYDELMEGARSDPSAENSISIPKINEKIEDLTPRFLSEVLKIINYYYLEQGGSEDQFLASMNIDSKLQLMFRWLRTTRKEDDNNDEGVAGGSDSFDAKSTDEMERKIRRLVRRRRKERKAARNRGKKRSFMDWLVADKDTRGWTHFNVMHLKASSIGKLLSRHVCDCFFMVLESGDSFSKFRDYLKCVLKLLAELDKTTAIKRVNSVIGAAEDYLLGRRRSDYPEDLVIKNRANRAQNERMDHILEAFLREVLCLESILSYPNLSEDEFFSRTVKELKTFQSALEVCEKEVEKIGFEMVYLTTIHNFIFDEDRDGLLMDDFRTTLNLKILETWERLHEGYEPN